MAQKTENSAWISMRPVEKCVIVLFLIFVVYFILMILLSPVTSRLIEYLFTPVYGCQYNAYFQNSIARAEFFLIPLLGLAACAAAFAGYPKLRRAAALGMLTTLCIATPLGIGVLRSVWDYPYVAADNPPSFVTEEYTVSQATSSRRGERHITVNLLHVVTPEGKKIITHVPGGGRLPETGYQVKMSYLPHTGEVIHCEVFRSPAVLW